MGKEVGGGWDAVCGRWRFTFTEGAAGSTIQTHLIKVKQDGFIVCHNSLTSRPPALSPHVLLI